MIGEAIMLSLLLYTSRRQRKLWGGHLCWVSAEEALGGTPVLGECRGSSGGGHLCWGSAEEALGGTPVLGECIVLKFTDS